MSDELIVIGTYVLSYVVIIGYAARLHLRLRRAKD